MKRKGASKKEWKELNKEYFELNQFTDETISLAFKLNNLMSGHGVVDCVAANAIVMNAVASTLKDQDGSVDEDSLELLNWYFSHLLEAFMPFLSEIDPTELVNLAQEAMNEQLH